MALFHKILIANRGEIAVRVARTCRALGIPTVAVYSDADRDALHVRECDEAVRIGPAEARHSYLDIEALVDAARRAGADAVHPGYGFLSQNARLRRRGGGGRAHLHRPARPRAPAHGRQEGRAPPDGQRGRPRRPRLRRRRPGRRDARGRGGAHRLAGDDQALARRRRQGHARGARRQDFAAALAAVAARGPRAPSATTWWCWSASCRGRATSRCRSWPTATAAVVHLLERECSIQRRHQKVVEETPSPALTDAARRSLCQAGVAAARAARYVNAGTVEFLLDARRGASTSWR